METTANQPFKEIITLEEFLQKKSAKPADLHIATTTNGKVVLTLFGSMVATIKSDIKGADAKETAAIWKNKAINLCFGMPHDGSIGENGKPALPCAMESKSQWEEVSAF